jgi:hypothetical protein
MSEVLTTKHEIEKRYSKLLSDEQFEELSLKAETPNLFRILGISNYEIRHSNFLAWLIDPNETHGLGNYVLQKIFQDILIDPRAKNISILDVGNISDNEVEVRREWKNIDVLVITDQLVVCIENKVWAKESAHQLKKYKEIVEKEFPEHKPCYVFLTPTGYESTMPNVYIEYSYERIVEILENGIKIRKKTINPAIKIYIKDYITLIKQNIMNNDNTNQIAKKLYLNHKELFDFVFENKPDYWDDFYNILSEKVKDKGWILGSKNKGFVRFTTKNLEPLILKYKKANGWSDKESFLFELVFDSGSKLKFISTVAPAKDYYEYDERIVELLCQLSGSKKKEKLGKRWKTHFTEVRDWKLEEIMMNWNDGNNDYDDKLEKFLNEKVEPIVEKVEAHLLKHKDELLKLKQEFENE